MPICFVFDGKCLYSPIDEKPKRTTPLELRRVKNILANPKVSLVIDYYNEDWKRLAYILIFATARMLNSGARHRGVVNLLRKKYRQYRSMSIDRLPIICVTPKRFRTWGDL